MRTTRISRCPGHRPTSTTAHATNTGCCPAGVPDNAGPTRPPPASSDCPSQPGDFTGVGAPRWRQRAFYDSVKDALNNRQLARVSVYDTTPGRTHARNPASSSRPNKQPRHPRPRQQPRTPRVKSPRAGVCTGRDQRSEACVFPPPVDHAQRGTSGRCGRPWTRVQSRWSGSVGTRLLAGVSALSTVEVLPAIYALIGGDVGRGRAR
jgi:hypothetical protein